MAWLIWGLGLVLNGMKLQKYPIKSPYMTDFVLFTINSLGYKVFITMINTQVHGMLTKFLAATATNATSSYSTASQFQSNQSGQMSRSLSSGSSQAATCTASGAEAEVHHHPQMGDLHRRKTEPAIMRSSGSYASGSLPTGAMADAVPAASQSGVETRNYSTQVHLQVRSPKQSIADIEDESEDENSRSAGQDVASDQRERALDSTRNGCDIGEGVSGPNMNGATGGSQNDRANEDEESQAQGCSVV
jgi:hypothetical protein